MDVRILNTYPIGDEVEKVLILWCFFGNCYALRVCTKCVGLWVVVIVLVDLFRLITNVGVDFYSMLILYLHLQFFLYRVLL